MGLKKPYRGELDDLLFWFFVTMAKVDSNKEARRRRLEGLADKKIEDLEGRKKQKERKDDLDREQKNSSSEDPNTPEKNPKASKLNSQSKTQNF